MHDVVRWRGYCDYFVTLCVYVSVCVWAGVYVIIKAVTVTRYINVVSRSCISMITRKFLFGVTCNLAQ